MTLFILAAFCSWSTLLLFSDVVQQEQGYHPSSSVVEILSSPENLRLGESDDERTRGNPSWTMDGPSRLPFHNTTMTSEEKSLCLAV